VPTRGWGGDASATAAWYAETFGTTTTERNGEVVFEESGLALAFEDGVWDKEKMGLIGVGVEVADAAAVAALCPSVAELEVCASMVPDEDPAKETAFAIGELTDPAGLSVTCLAQTAPANPPPRLFPAPKLALTVSDLDASIEFYTNALGMQLLRKRALLPDIPAMSAFLGFSSVASSDDLVDSAEGADDQATPRVELRYVYNNDDVAPANGLGDILICDADPDAIRAAAEAHGGSVDATPDDEQSVRVFDPDGYAFLVSSSSSSS